jgi:cob(I)alamin adenosyltransferase
MVYLSRIYTKSGDAGETGLGDGTRVLKSSARVTAYGEVDELNAVLGLVAAVVATDDRGLIQQVQNNLFDLGADLCCPPAHAEGPGHALRVTADQVERLEREIDRRNERLEPLRTFVLPGGTLPAAWLHLARTVCRRAERAVVALMQTEAVNPNVLVYLNRLSDLLFVMARVANDNGQADVLWVPGQAESGG